MCLALMVWSASMVTAATTATTTPAKAPTFHDQLKEHWLKQLVAGSSKSSARVDPRKAHAERAALDAAGAVDGNRYEDPRRPGFHTEKDKAAWWQVDLGKSVEIGKIIIANRRDCSHRAHNLVILVSEDGRRWGTIHDQKGVPFAGWDKKTEPLTVLPKLPPKSKETKIAGRYVRVQLRNDYLHLNEVEVYAKGDLKTNIALNQPATQSSVHSMSAYPKVISPVKGKTHAKVGISKPGRDAGAEDIKAALDLAKRTLEYVEKSKKLPRFAKILRTQEAQWAKGVKPNEYNKFFFRVRGLRRATILSHPSLDFEKILINRAPPAKYSHNGDQHLGRHSTISPGLTILTDWKTAQPKATSILKGKLPEGAVRNPDLHYDADKVVFAYCDHTKEGQRRFFLYEAAIDGSAVRKLTGTKRDTFQTWNNRATAFLEDNDPVYLPGGDIMFISTRSQSYGRCHGGRYNPAWVLHRCDKDGNTIRQISYGNENEYEPSVLNDGRVIFCRWEYTNRHEMLFHMLWWCHPDGSKVSHYFGNDMLHPMMITEATAIPGTTKVVGTAMGHHSYSTGTTVVLDTTKGENTEDAIQRITPETPYSESHGWPSPHYSHPYPINEEIFLVSRANHHVHKQGETPPVNDRAIYLVDSLGGRELIYEDPTVASFSPIPVRKRKAPPVLASALPKNAPKEGTLFVQNAYLTRNDPEKKIKPGSIKAIRVIAIGVQPRISRAACSMTVTVEIPKKVLGTVPVSKDGAAWFKAPSGTALQLQILDKSGRAILTEKSFFYLQPGENRSCVGCHEPEGTSPLPQSAALLKGLRPMDLTPSAGPQYPGGMSFMRTVQPVLDRYCIGCHGLEGKPKGGVNLIHDGKLTWPRPARELIARGKHRLGLKTYMGGTYGIGKEHNISRPYEFYAYGNKVSGMLLKGHGKTNMDRESYMRVIEWLDVNAQCYGDLFPNKLEERTIDPKALRTLRAYIATLLPKSISEQPERALINTVQVDESRILMLGLPKSAGGWGQLKCFSSKSDPKYIKTKRLVEACIIKNPNENTRGWEPTLMMGGGDGQFIKERQRFTQEVLGRSTVDISDAKMKIKIKDDTRASEAIRKAREQRKAKRSGAKNRK
jgi:hypothetical protein